jgi:hypothetical protein
MLASLLGVAVVAALVFEQFMLVLYFPGLRRAVAALYPAVRQRSGLA